MYIEIFSVHRFVGSELSTMFRVDARKSNRFNYLSYLTMDRSDSLASELLKTPLEVHVSTTKNTALTNRTVSLSNYHFLRRISPHLCRTEKPILTVLSVDSQGGLGVLRMVASRAVQSEGLLRKPQWRRWPDTASAETETLRS